MALDRPNEGPGRNEETRRRLPYQRPTIVRVPLRPEEAVLGGCKTTNAAGPNANPCPTVLVCSTPGS